MTRKQYEGKMRQLQHNINKQAKIYGNPTSKSADRVNIPNFGVSPITGEDLRSYAAMWELVTRYLIGTPLMEGIKL